MERGAKKIGLLTRSFPVWSFLSSYNFGEGFISSNHSKRGRIKKMAFLQKKAKHYLIFLWMSVGLMAIVSPLAAIYEEEISESPFLILLMMLIMIPTGIAYLSLASEAVKMLKSKLLFLVPLLFFPYFLIIVISFAPFAYLIYLTHGYRKLTRLG